MTKICREIIDHPSAWTSQSLGGKEALVQRLSPAHLAAIDELLAKTRHLRPQAVTREQFDHPALNPFLKNLFETIQNGVGVAIVRGVTREKYSEEDFERIYWGFGTHLGVAVTQSALGDRLGHVRFTPVGPDNPAGRAYRSNRELDLHTDTNEIVGLMSVQKAKSGGLSRLISSLAIHNEILKTRPELLEVLYEGFYYATTEAQLTSEPITKFKVPLYCYVDGKVSCTYTNTFIYRAADMLGGMPDDLREAMDYITELTHRPDLMLEFTIEPGEMAIWNNFTLLHARTAFEDYDEPELKRHLLRLWVDVPQGRPVLPVYLRNSQLYQFDPVKHRSELAPAQ